MTRCPNCGSETSVASKCGTCDTPVESGADGTNGGRRNQHERTGPQREQRRPPGNAQSGSQTGLEGTGEPRSLPTGIKAICLLLGVFGTGLAFVGLVLGDGGRATAYSATGTLTLGDLAVLFVALGFGQYLAVYGLWTRKSWGCTAGLFVAGVGGLMSLLALAGGTTANGLLGLVLYGGVGWYLYRHRWVYGRGSAREKRTGAHAGSGPSGRANRH